VNDNNIPTDILLMLLLQQNNNRRRSSEIAKSVAAVN